MEKIFKDRIREPMRRGPKVREIYLANSLIDEDGGVHPPNTGLGRDNFPKGYGKKMSTINEYGWMTNRDDAFL